MTNLKNVNSDREILRRGGIDSFILPTNGYELQMTLSKKYDYQPFNYFFQMQTFGRLDLLESLA